jgi:SAM-dependent methyltransferase
VGCGPGNITVELAAAVAPGLVTGVDASAYAVDLARATAESAASPTSTTPRLEFVLGDALALSFADASYDVVHAHQVLQHLAEPVAALVEMRRVCRPGGLIAVRDGDYAGMTWYPQVPALDEWQDLYRRIARRNGGEPDAGRRLLSWAHAAGLRDVTATASTWCYATPDERAWWGTMWADRMTDSTIATQAMNEGYATRSDLERIAAGWRTWAADPDGWFAAVHGEVLARR